MKEVINNYLASFNNWLGVIGFILTLITLAMTLNIRGKIEQTLGKQRFLQQREELISSFKNIRLKIADLDAEGERRKENVHISTAYVLDLRALTLRLTHLKIWKLADRLVFWRFIRRIAPKMHISGAELVMKIDEIIAIVESQAVV